MHPKGPGISSVRQLKAEVDDLLAAEKRPTPTVPETRRALCEEHAASAYRASVLEMPRETWSVRKFASAIERSPRMHLDYGSGARSIPVDVVLMLPTPARGRFVSELAKSLPRTARLELAQRLLAELDECSDVEDETQVA